MKDVIGSSTSGPRAATASPWPRWWASSVRRRVRRSQDGGQRTRRGLGRGIRRLRRGRGGRGRGDVLRSGEPRLLHFGIADAEAWDVGLPCGGEIDVFVEEYRQ